MPYGKEAKEELVKLIEGKCLRVLVYNEDRYGRSVGDVYCNGIYVQVVSLVFVWNLCNIHLSNLFLHFNQEMMLKKGLAWHYVAYDQRSELAKVSFVFFVYPLTFNFLCSNLICIILVGK